MKLKKAICVFLIILLSIIIHLTFLYNYKANRTSWILFGLHVLFLPPVILYWCYGFSCIDDTYFCKSLHFPYYVDANVKSHLNKFEHSSILLPVSRDNDIYKLVLDLVSNSWMYEERLGTDSYGLNHEFIEVKQVYYIKNSSLETSYQAVHSHYELDEETSLMSEVKQLNCVRKSNNPTDTIQESRRYQSISSLSVLQGVNCVPTDSSRTSLNSKQKFHTSLTSQVPETLPVQSGPPCMPTETVQGPYAHTFLQQNGCSCANTTGLPCRQDQEQTTLDELASSLQRFGCYTSCSVTEQETDHVIDDPLPTENETSDLNKNVDMIHSSEWYLFHGTCIENILPIAKRGFDMKKSKAGLYGKGIYLAESSEKADQYADHGASRRRDTNLTMLIVRIKPGKVRCFQEHEEFDTDPEMPLVNNDATEHANTIIAGKGKRFREFIVKDPARCLPQYLVVYNRVNRDLQSEKSTSMNASFDIVTE